MDRETIAERWNCFQREGRYNNKHKGWRDYQKERRDMRADQSETQQITFTAAAQSSHHPLTDLSHTQHLYRSWSHHIEFMSHIAHVLHTDPELLRMIHFQTLKSSEMCSVIQWVWLIKQLTGLTEPASSFVMSAPLQDSGLYKALTMLDALKQTIQERWRFFGFTGNPWWKFVFESSLTSSVWTSVLHAAVRVLRHDTAGLRHCRPGWSLCRVMDIRFMTEMLQWIHDLMEQDHVI